MKLHEYTIEKSLILNPKMLSENNRKILLHLFDEIKNESFPSLLQQLKSKYPFRVKIDKTILKLLGFSDDEIRGWLDFLYPALANEIQQLKTLMEG